MRTIPMRLPCRPCRLTLKPRATTFRPRLLVMVKRPELGRVKTRLGREIGAVTATGFYRATSRAVIGRLAADPRWTTSLAIAPDTAIRDRAWPLRVSRLAQGSGDLGRRMHRIAGQPRPGPVIIVGTDIPAIEPRHVWRAFRALGSCDAVLGPAADGGFWLVGFRRTPRLPAAFDNVRWSTAHTLADTVASLHPATIAFADTLSDVDTAAEHSGCRAWSGRNVLPAFGP